MCRHMIFMFERETLRRIAHTNGEVVCTILLHLDLELTSIYFAFFPEAQAPHRYITYDNLFTIRDILLFVRSEHQVGDQRLKMLTSFFTIPDSAGVTLHTFVSGDKIF